MTASTAIIQPPATLTLGSSSNLTKNRALHRASTAIEASSIESFPKDHPIALEGTTWLSGGSATRRFYRVSSSGQFRSPKIGLRAIGLSRTFRSAVKAPLPEPQKISGETLMKLTKMALAAAIATALFGSAAFAQQTGVSTRVTSNAYDYYTQEGASPSDKAPGAAAPAAPAPTVMSSTDAVMVECEAEEEEEGLPALPTMQGIMDERLCLSDRNIFIGGSIAQSFTANFDNPNNRFNGPVTWTDRSNEYQLNQAWVYGEKRTNTEDQDWDWGFRTDAFWGTNARWAVAQGLEDQINGAYQFYGIAIPNAYATLAYQDTTLKVGHFVSPVGYFTIDTTQNFFNTIPYTYQYGEPFTHTGAWVNQKMSDTLNVGGGVTRGWDNVDGGRGNPQTGSPNAGAFGMAALANDSGSSLTWFGHWSNELNQNFGFTSRYIQSLVFQMKVSENITFVSQSDYGNQDQALANGASAQWFGSNNYLFLKLTDRVTWGTNVEWFRDDDGFRVGTVLPPSSAYSFRGSPLAGGYAGDFYQCTTGPKISLMENLILRPNVRFDWYTGLDNGPGTRPYVDGNLNQQVILATDLLWIF